MQDTIEYAFAKVISITTWGHVNPPEQHCHMPCHTPTSARGLPRQQPWLIAIAAHTYSAGAAEQHYAHTISLCCRSREPILVVFEVGI